MIRRSHGQAASKALPASIEIATLVSVNSRLHKAFSKTQPALGNKIECTPFVEAPTTIEAPELGIKMKVDSPVIFIKPTILFRAVALRPH